MCGGFAIILGSSTKNVSQACKRQLVYSAGRIITYAFLGAVAGYLGQRLLRFAPRLIHTAAILCIVAGVLLVVQGAQAAGFFSRRKTTPANACLLGSAFRSFLTSPGYWNALTAGILTGFLPCGLVYAYLALAVSSGHALWGLLVMVFLGFGTIPLMVLTGLGAARLSVTWRTRLLRFAATCVILTGVLTIYRGVSFVNHPVGSQSTCPFCSNQ